MARGWESKSVEAQIEESTNQTSGYDNQTMSPNELQTTLRKNDLLLSRNRVLQELEGSANERHRELLRRSLTALEAQIAELS